MTDWAPGTLVSGGTENLYNGTELEISACGRIYDAYGSGLTYQVDEDTGVVTFLSGTIASMSITGFGQSYMMSGLSKNCPARAWWRWQKIGR
jgi:hypothetical protein